MTLPASTLPASILRQDEIQSLVFLGYSRLHARLLLLRSVGDDANEPHAERRTALARLAQRVGFGKPRQHRHRAVQLALSLRGLLRLGLGDAALQTFPLTFRRSMEDEHHCRALGDQLENAPDHWRWSGDAVDAVVFLYAADTAALDALQADIVADVEPTYRVEHELPTVRLHQQKEHFGFRDGLSQPRLRELKPDSPEAIAAGEIVLGYPDESGETPPVPHDGDVNLGRDGSFLVLRQLAQDVAGFWQALRQRSKNDSATVELAAKLMGRWPDGRPLGQDDPRATPSFADDPHGLVCPRGAHIRRANPRDALHQNIPGVDPEASLAESRRHRLLRRGRNYGAPASVDIYPEGLAVTAQDQDPAPPEAERGLYFACLCADLSRQFELVQQSWLNNTKHDHLYDEVCPIASGRDLPADDRRFTIPQEPVRRRLKELPHFVTVRGSGYFFLPGRSALEYLVGERSDKTEKLQKVQDRLQSREPVETTQSVAEMVREMRNSR